MINFYADTVSEMPDEELARLAKEIKNAGVLADDGWDYRDTSDTSWEAQAYRRWHTIVDEQHKRDRERNPGKYKTSDALDELLNVTHKQLTQAWAESLFQDNPFKYRIR